MTSSPLPLANRDSFEIIDLSITLDTDPSPLVEVKVTNIDHHDGALQNQRERDIDPDDWAWPGYAHGDDMIEASSHGGSHMDAPIHYGPWTIPDKEKPLTIDQWPLDWCMGDGVVLDIRDLPTGYELSAAEVQERLGKIGYELKPLDIFLTMTGNDKVWDQPEEYMTRGGHLGRESLKWVLEQGVKVVGTDSWSFDRPGASWVKDYLEHDRDPTYVWPCHQLGLEMPYAHMEKLCNLDALPQYGFTFIGLPIKVRDGSAGYIRAVGLVPNGKG
jgi:kynurenine formamidase